MKVAIVHDWITGMRGGERCLQAFLSIYPEADIFTMLHVPGSTSPQIDRRVKQVSYMSRLPGASKYYRYLLPFYPLFIRQLDVSGYDLVISLSHAAAKNVRVPSTARHICYCFTPMRYVWDQSRRYFGKLTGVIWPILKLLRNWDVASSRGVTKFVGISKFIAARIRCFYGREADVLYPPVDTAWIHSSNRKCERVPEGQPAFLYAGALVPYKRVDAVVEAFNELGLPLWVVGSGPEEEKLRKIAGKNISFFGYVSDSELVAFYKSCRALLFPVKEDFGLVPIECMAAGRPVIALNDGACSETVIGLKPWDEAYNSALPPETATGVFIKKTSEGELAKHIISSVKFYISKENSIAPAACIAHADKYGMKRFFQQWEIIANSEMGVTSQSKSSDKEAASC